jgi:hypothetical protein
VPDFPGTPVTLLAVLFQEIESQVSEVVHVKVIEVSVLDL